MTKAKPRCIVIAGPNGAGKTTFAIEYLLKYAGVVRFLNADSMAKGLSPLKPELAAMSAGRLFLGELDRMAAAREDFAFETTLSGMLHLRRLKAWKESGYFIEIVYLRLSSVELSLNRVATRVQQGGHNIPEEDIRRRFERGLENFEKYTLIADYWGVYDSSEFELKLLEEGP